MRLWDFERGYFRWFEVGKVLSINNEGTTPIDFVEIEIL